jgi:hypothetical protein
LLPIAQILQRHDSEAPVDQTELSNYTSVHFKKKERRNYVPLSGVFGTYHRRSAIDTRTESPLRTRRIR